MQANVLLLAQMVKTFALPALWVWPFWLIVGGAVAFLYARYRQLRRLMAEATANVSLLTTEHASAVLFRCTDTEILQLAKLPDTAAVEAWVADNCRDSLRWQVMRQRFLLRRAEGPVTS